MFMAQIHSELIDGGDYWIFPRTGRRVTKHSLKVSIDQFNEKCPIEGGWLDRAHPHTIRNKTHVTLAVKIVDNCIIADVEPIADIDLSECEPKPIVVAPCDDEEVIAEIIGIQIERKL
jgi:hypothetical protein